MIPVRQTKFVDTSENGHGNCMSACLASLLELPLANVIDTSADETYAAGWWKSVFSWINDRGFRLDHRAPDSDALLGQYSIGYGPSPRGDFDHAIVCKNGIMVFDPHPSDDGVVQIRSHDILIPLEQNK